MEVAVGCQTRDCGLISGNLAKLKNFLQSFICIFINKNYEEVCGVLRYSCPQGCDWIVITQTSTISQSESNIGDEPVEDAFKSTFASQGNVWEYEVETVDYNPSLFQPDGKVCQFSYGS
ncbi:hypothetical protein [Archaeoglobus sp.]|uniref:hypothetical protein n=1 Tax=Archaeoglobus sp. TaxID=1872626 RepID=UPI00259107BC|nr:hypothetical protein [Archaeoglobus sp.]